MGKPVLRTKVCDLLGIEYPILSAGMGPSLIGEQTGAPVELVAAVSNAGGLGVLGGSGFTVDEMREAIRRPIDLQRGPLLRAHLLETGEQDFQLVIVMHHIVSDAWSMSTIISGRSASDVSIVMDCSLHMISYVLTKSYTISFTSCLSLSRVVCLE